MKAKQKKKKLKIVENLMTLVIKKISYKKTTTYKLKVINITTYLIFDNKLKSTSNEKWGKKIAPFA